MMYLDESMYSNFHFMWHTVLLLSTFFFLLLWMELLLNCMCVFPHFSWLSFQRLACLVTMSVHLSRRPYLKCFKRLLSVLIVIMGWTTSSGTYTLRLAVDTHICSPTHPNLYVNHCTYMCACSLFLSLTHTNTHIHKSTYIWRSMRKTKYQKTCFKKNVCYLIMQHMTKMKKI